MRLDITLATSHGLTRNKAQQLIRGGYVRIDGVITDRPAYHLSGQETLEIDETKEKTWVSRSAGKLDGFLVFLKENGYPLDLQTKNALDIGSSTGGFSQVLLEWGIDHIDAVDVGTDQFHAKIRDNEKISLYEKTDIRNFRSLLPYDIIVCDVSFISLREIIDTITGYMHPETLVFLLFKPQFEVGKSHLRKTGVPKNESIIQESLSHFGALLEQKGLEILEREKASVIGEAGNQEYMFFVKKRKNSGQREGFV